MDTEKNGLEELEQDLSNLCLDSSSPQVNALVTELEKLVVAGSSPKEIQTPDQGKVAVPCPELQRQVLLQFLEVLKSPHSPDRQQQILHILKNFPVLLAGFIKQRKLLQQAKVAFENQCLTYEKALAEQSHQAGNRQSIIVRRKQKLAIMRRRVRSAMSQQYRHHTDQQLLTAALKIQQRIRQLANLRNNGPSPHQEEVVAEFLHGMRSGRTAELRPFMMRILQLNCPDLFVVSRPYNTASLASCAQAKKQLLMQHLQMKALLTNKLLCQQLPNCRYEHSRDHNKPGQGYWNVGSLGQLTTIATSSRFPSVTCLTNCDIVESEEQNMIVNTERKQS